MLANTASQNLLMTERDAKYKKELSLCTDRDMGGVLSPE